MAQFTFASLVLWTLLASGKGDEIVAKYQSPRPHDPTDPVVYPTDYCAEIQQHEEFDFIVVGAGPAGSAIARRLAEVPEYRVLLVEAGDDPPAWTDVPELYMTFTFLPRNVPSMLWNVQTVPINLCRQGISRLGRCIYNLAKVLGGCSVVNGMMWIRGNKKDYDEWAEQGCPGWSYADMLPYFKKLENYLYEYNQTTPDFDKYHNLGGPMTASQWPIDSLSAILREDFIKTVRKMGFPINPDFSGPSQIGFGNIPGISQVNGYRYSSAKGYLLHNPDNLKICKQAVATKFELSSEKSVKNLQMIYSGGLLSKNIVVRAKKDYVVTGGPIGTPQLLERSGIGNCKVIESAGVQCLHELPGVGENFQDQFGNPGCSFFISLNNTVPLNLFTNDLLSLTGFLNITDPASQVPEVQFFIGLSRPPLINMPKKIKKIIKTTININIPENLAIMIVAPTISRQSKRGYVHISQTDPFVTPILNPMQYTSPQETKLACDACRLVRKIMASHDMAKYKATPIIPPACLLYKRDSDEEIMCEVRRSAASLFHMGGTTRMGPKTDKLAVVDTHLRVYGIPNLRVGDLSVMPNVPRGNTEIPTIAVAEKAADIIKMDHQKI